VSDQSREASESFDRYSRTYLPLERSLSTRVDEEPLDGEKHGVSLGERKVRKGKRNTSVGGLVVDKTNHASH
jgi:hypothetical protein